MKWTFYAVALLHQHKSTGEIKLCSVLVKVAGDDPLTNVEAIHRASAVVRTKFGMTDEWKRIGSDVCHLVEELP